MPIEEFETLNLKNDFNTLLTYKTTTLKVKEQYLSEKECQEVIDHVHDLVLDVEPTFKMFGRICTFHRCIGFFSDHHSGYKYSGQVAAAKPLTCPLKKLLKQVNSDLGSSFNGILINQYRNGEDYIGPPQ